MTVANALSTGSCEIHSFGLRGNTLALRSESESKPELIPELELAGALIGGIGTLPPCCSELWKAVQILPVSSMVHSPVTGSMAYNDCGLPAGGPRPWIVPFAAYMISIIAPVGMGPTMVR